MKQLIVLLAVLPLMIGLILQIGLSQSNFTSVLRAESIVRDCAGAAADEGGFTDGIRSEMANRLSEVCGAASGGIRISADKKPDGNGSLHYRVEVPVGKLVAAPGLFGVKEAGNSAVYVIEGSVYSRKTEEKTNDTGSGTDTEKKDDADDNTDTDKPDDVADDENIEKPGEEGESAEKSQKKPVE